MQRYWSNHGYQINLETEVLPQMKEIAGECIKSTYLFLDEERRENNFELFGLDFMLDADGKPWLIEVNTNPCLGITCPLLGRIIPHLMENTFRVGVDTVFPPPDHVPTNYKYTIVENALQYNRYELIFDEDRDGPEV